MKKEDLLKEMKESIGTKEPVVFFSKMVDVFNLLFNRIDSLESQIEKTKVNSIMAISWDARIAAGMVDDEIAFLRSTGKQSDGTNMYSAEILELQHEYNSRSHCGSYAEFCKFWEDILGYHPFLEARKE